MRVQPSSEFGLSAALAACALASLPAAEAGAEALKPHAAAPVEMAQAGQERPQAGGAVKLVKIVPTGRVILAYVSPKDEIVPAQIVDVDGNVSGVEDIGDASVVWVAVDANGVLRPLEIEPDGSLSPARVDAAGKPLLSRAVPAGQQVFAAQVAVDGRLLPIVYPIGEGLRSVEVAADGTIVAQAPTVASAAPVAKKHFKGTISLDNSGDTLTGIPVLTGSVSHDDLWGLGHVGTLIGIVSATEPLASKTLIGSYGVPVSGMVEGLDDFVSLSAFYSSTRYGTQPPGGAAQPRFRIKSYSGTLTFSQNLYQHTAEDGSQTVHGVTYAFTYDKSWTRDYGNQPVALSSITRMPASITYNLTHVSDTIGVFTLGVGYTHNIPVSSADDGPDYEADRPGATPRYDKFNLDFTYGIDFESGWTVESTIFAQYADAPLITAETFSLGGLTSIRGLEDDKTLGEKGISGQFQVTTPNLLPLKDFSGRPFGFVDAGYLQKVDPPVGEARTEGAVSVGGGVKLTGPGSTFLNFAAGWLVGGSAVERYRAQDGRLQLYVSGGVNF